MVKRLLGLFLLVIISVTGIPAAAQIPEAITMSVSAGFDGSFREGEWLPVYIRVSNDGGDVEGRLVVRPETSNNAVNSAYSLPISLPNGARKAVFLYITAQSFATQIRVELIDDSGVVIAAEPATLRSLQSRDQLQVVISQSASGVVDLTGVHEGGYSGFQANWRIENIPDRATALRAVNMIMFSDIDSGTLSSAQKEAISDWVSQGGHLIVTGGTNWQGTAAGLRDLLPFVPQASTSLDSLTPIADWMHFSGSNLSQQAVVATGTVQPDAKVMVKTADDMPLLVRRTFGTGVVDYLVADPNAVPLRGWGGLSDLWLTLATNTEPHPSWSYGVTDWDVANSAINVLPGIDLLPDILPLCGFLALYIALVGPLNYLVLNKINRREFAWVTIPLFIVIFSALAWVVGFNLRGNEVTLSRLTLVESWSDAPHARVQQLVGLLSPRRAQYSLSVLDNSFLRPIPVTASGSTLLGGSNLQLSTAIEQSDVFQATDFPVDASFIAPFHAVTTVVKPEIGGTATIIFDTQTDLQKIRGSVSNNTDFVLNDPVILARGQVLRLENPLLPGDVVPFDLALSGNGLPSPSPLAFEVGGFRSVYFRVYSRQNTTTQTIADIMGDQLDDRKNYFYQGIGSTTEEQEIYRRRLFLSSFIDDPYNVLTGRGDQVYLAGWSSQAPLGVDLQGGNWKSLDTTLYLTQLAGQVTRPAGEALISSDQFTWMVQSPTTVSDAAPLGMTLQPGDEVIFRFTPLPYSVLQQVNQLTVYVDRGQNLVRNFPVDVWDWHKADWEPMVIPSGSQLDISEPERFIGPENAVQVRIVADDIGSYPRFDNLTVEQRGQF